MGRTDAQAMAAALAGSTVAAMQGAALATLRAELLALRLVMPCHETVAEADARHRAEDAAAEEAFDNLPV